ncbi:MAG TPA: deoxyribonuclease IV [Desulfurococcales archaeon]|nr:deoxyribonuclease IV [Desulfurococcales archaeon]
MVRFRFGPAGKPVEYRGSTVDIPFFLKSIGLDAFEYQAVRGVRISREDAELLGVNARKSDVLVSIHAPYYINFSSQKEDVIDRSVERLCETVKVANYMGAYVVVFHPGYYGGFKPDEALRKVISGLLRVREFMESEGITSVWLGPETTGKTSQVGSVDEVISICREVGKSRPVIDWAHIYARSKGTYITSIDHVIEVIDRIEKELGRDALNPLHCHFSKISYGRGGEREHVVLADKAHGPDFKIVCKGLLEVGVDTVIISESPILEKDALVMKRVYEELLSAYKT